MTENEGQAREDLPELDLKEGKELVLAMSRSLVVGGVEKARVASIAAPTACIGPAMQRELNRCWWPLPGLHLRLWPQRAPGRRASQQAIAICYFHKRKALFSKTLEKHTQTEIAHKSSMFLESREGGRGGLTLSIQPQLWGCSQMSSLGRSFPSCQQTYLETHQVVSCCTCWSAALEKSAFKYNRDKLLGQNTSSLF